MLEDSSTPYHMQNMIGAQARAPVETWRRDSLPLKMRGNTRMRAGNLKSIHIIGGRVETGSAFLPGGPVFTSTLSLGPISERGNNAGAALVTCMKQFLLRLGFKR